MANKENTRAQRLPPRQEDEILRERMAAKYRAVFGEPPGPGQAEQRTPEQVAVWEDLQVASYFLTPTHVPNQAGEIDQLRAALTEGRRTLFLYIRANVLHRSKVAETPA